MNLNEFIASLQYYKLRNGNDKCLAPSGLKVRPVRLVNFYDSLSYRPEINVYIEEIYRPLVQDVMVSDLGMAMGYAIPEGFIFVPLLRNTFEYLSGSGDRYIGFIVQRFELELCNTDLQYRCLFEFLNFVEPMYDNTPRV